MSLLRVLYRRPNHLSFIACRHISTAPTNEEPRKKQATSTTAAPPTPVSSCIENTKIEGVNYLKNQAVVLASPDDQYPEWLWTILQPRVYEDEGPGSKADKVKRRRENKQRIRDRNFMSTQ